MCKKNLEGLIADESQLSTICKALLLHATVEKDAKEIRNLGIATIETYDKSQTKYMLFQAVLNHITKPTYTIEEIKKYGREIIKTQKTVRMHYFHPSNLGYSNWGDVLGPEEVLKLSGINVVPASSVSSNSVTFYGIGSILGPVLGDKNSWYVWGSGLIMKPSKSLSSTLKSGQKLFSVRGPESQIAVLAMRGVLPFVAKDPGLLTSKLFPLKKSPKYPMCIIPHYVDSLAVKSAIASRRNSIKIVPITIPLNFKDHVIDVPKNVIECEKVVSSSLHGLIVSHSYGIPAAVITLSTKIAGGNYKYRDYYESLGLFMNRDVIRHEIRNKDLLNNLTYLSDLVGSTPQPKQPISMKSILDTYPFPMTEKNSALFGDEMNLVN